MAATNYARHAEDVGNQRHDERENGGKTATFTNHISKDEEAKRMARAWREGKERVWAWWVERLADRLSSGKHYASMRSFTDDASQNFDFVDNFGRKVTVPHNRGLGRGIALLMAEEHPEFGQLFRMRKGAK